MTTRAEKDLAAAETARRMEARERRAQVRGLLLLAFVVLALLLWRAAAPLHLFHAGWWRL